MGRKSKISFEDKCKAVDDFLNNKRGVNELAREYQVNPSSVLKWISNYQSMGIEGLRTVSTNAAYSEELKLLAIQEYLSGQGSQQDICKKYAIRSKKQLQDWIFKYNNHEKIKSSRTGGKSIMIKGRLTTFDERIEIVKYCIEHNKNYNETAEKYHVSYQQVRSWTLKHEESGVDALTDNRGKRKLEDQLTELERLKAQNKLLEAKNKRLEMENELLKKLEELERG